MSTVTFTTTIPAKATDTQKSKIETVLARMAEHYKMEFSSPKYGRNIFFSLRSERWFDSMVCGTIGPRGGLDITIYPCGHKSFKRSGRAAWSRLRIECFSSLS